MKHLLPTLLLSLLLCTTSGCQKEELIATSDELTKFLQQEMTDQSIPGMAVLAFKGETVTYENYLGKANRETGESVTAQHLFLLASVSKTVTATALLQLWEQGKFDLDDPINPHLPFAVQPPGTSTPITFRMLLTHTSAIADGPALDGQYYDGEDSPVDLADFLQNYLTPGGSFYDAGQNFHSFEPGTQHEYSNEGSALIAVLVEQLSGMDFNSYCKQHIFGPLGMNNTHWKLAEINQPIVTPYDYYDGQWEAHAHYTFTDYPNGGLRSNAQDLFRLARALAGNGSSGGVQVLQASTVQAMQTSQIASIDPEVGLHLFVMSEEDGLWGHDGGEKGVSTILAWNPANQTGAIILTNQGEADLEAMLEEVYWFASDSE